MNFFKHIIDELPSHITNPNGRTKVSQLFHYEKKEENHFHACDTCLAALHYTALTNKLLKDQLISTTVHQFAEVLMKFSEIAYTSYHHRSTRSILHYTNLTFLLSLLTQ